jgi:YgiT-type zinc finger domain-containing protein
MKCGICKAETEKRFISYTEDSAGSVIVVRNVPANVCTECGNVWYTGAVSAHIEEIVDAIIKTANTEVAVVNYSEPTGSQPAGSQHVA